jgi:hypothetical protein
MRIAECRMWNEKDLERELFNNSDFELEIQAY